MCSVSQKINALRELDQSKLQAWEVTAIKEAEASKDDLAWSEIDVVSEIYGRYKNA